MRAEAVQQRTVESCDLYEDKCDKQVHPLTSISLNLKKASPVEVPLYLYQAQMRANELWALNFQLIDGKNGWIRGNVLGGEFNFTSRAVIVLDPTLKIDEIDLSYKGLIVLFRGHLIRRICKDKGWTVTKASNYLASKFNYDPYVYSLMMRVIEEYEVQMILNRNPEVAGYSI